MGAPGKREPVPGEASGAHGAGTRSKGGKRGWEPREGRPGGPVEEESGLPAPPALGQLWESAVSAALLERTRPGLEGKPLFEGDQKGQEWVLRSHYSWSQGLSAQLGWRQEPATSPPAVKPACEARPPRSLPGTRCRAPQEQEAALHWGGCSVATGNQPRSSKVRQMRGDLQLWPPASCEALSKSLGPSGPQLPHLERGSDRMPLQGPS